MSTDTPIPLSWPVARRGYALGMLLVGAVSLVGAGFITAVLGGDGQSIVIGSIALALGIAISLAPIIVGVKADMFAMAVLAASGARMLVALGIVFIAALTLDLARKPIGLGVGAALLLTLIAETMLTLAILSRVNRKTELA